ncbi:ATP-binding protein [Streptomyces sp. H27-D2]|uniref:ATP-binding protein n=1 Tax=Streptomyces sp. H27-D2 TaxID=3046304 RepID=UPI002DB78EBD|nr:ATP-binding protein [Streptomyces sp. H27-D2]MEC4015195.1 ATP-binding protein [Streptomyces sp. H27-D2]
MATVSPGWGYALHLPHDPRAPRIARTTLRAVLGSHGMGSLIDIAELLAGELVTNAYQHTEGPAELRLRELAGRLRISVWDTDPVIPPLFHGRACSGGRPVPLPVHVDADANAESGRGLELVRLCADDWGGYRLGDDIFGVNGKLLWFELARPPAAASRAGGFTIAA